jgi:hypothetical protein
MVVTIWCAIGTEREGDFAGKTASRNAPDHGGVSGKQAISRRCFHSRDSSIRSDSA